MLTIKDIQILIEAVDAWEKKSSVDSLMGTMLSAMFSRSKEDFERIQADMNKDDFDSVHLEQIRKEKAILLKAKLIQIRDKLLMEHDTITR